MQEQGLINLAPFYFPKVETLRWSVSVNPVSRNAKTPQRGVSTRFYIILFFLACKNVPQKFPAEFIYRVKRQKYPDKFFDPPFDEFFHTIFLKLSFRIFLKLNFRNSSNTPQFQTRLKHSKIPFFRASEFQLSYRISEEPPGSVP